MKHLSENGIWSDTVRSLKETGKLNGLPAHELTAFLAAIRFTFKEFWPEDATAKPTSLLCKTTGIGAIMQFLPDVYNALPVRVLEDSKNQYDILSYAALVSEMHRLIKPLKPYGQMFFSLSKESKYVGGAGKGMQTRLYNDICEKWKNSI